MISGVLLLEGRPLGGQDVLAFDGPELVGTATTDDEGAFSIDSAAEGAALVGKVRSDAGIALAASEGGGELAAPGPLHRVRLRLEGELGPLTVFIDPVRLDGVPEEVVPLAKQVRPGVIESHYVQRSAPDGALELRVAPGTWNVGGGHIIPDRDRGRQTIVGAARADGAELAGNPYSGFELEVARDRDVTLVVRELRRDER